MLLWVSALAPIVVVALLVLRLGHSPIPHVSACAFKACIGTTDPPSLDYEYEEGKGAKGPPVPPTPVRITPFAGSVTVTGHAAGTLVTLRA